MKKILLGFVACLSLISCKKEVCPQGIDALPMYGRVQKCKIQLDNDRKFVEVCEEQYGSKDQACQEMLRFGWKHFADGNLDDAMKRFNQAWMLDSLDADVYAGFANVLTAKGEFNESLGYFDRSLSLKPQSAGVLFASATSSMHTYDETHDRRYLERTIAHLKQSLAINPSNESGYAMLTTAYAHSEQKDSARKYLKMVDKMNPDLIEKEIREYILQ